MSRILPLISHKVHYTLYGFQTIINIIYSYPNKRSSSKEFWLDLIESWFKFQATKSKSGENNIQVVSGRNSSKDKRSRIRIFSGGIKSIWQTAKPDIFSHGRIHAGT